MEMILNIRGAASFYCVELQPVLLCQVNFGKGRVKIKGCNRLFSPLSIQNIIILLE